MTKREPRVLYYGDNLEVMRLHVDPESVDLIYLDPPFNSNATYGVLFETKDGSAAPAQIKAFDDTWQWDMASRAQFEAVVEKGGKEADALRAFRTLLGDNDMLAYLTMMAPRLVEMRRALKPTGSIYLHCDPTASHYLKMLMDAVFGGDRFVAEIIWKRTNARGTKKKWPRVHDVILFYSRSEKFTFNSIQVLGDKAKIPHTLIKGEDGQKYQTYELTGAGITKKGESGKPWRGYDPSPMGRHWGNTHARMDEWDRQGLIHWPRKTGKKGGFPRRRADTLFVPEKRTVTVSDIWVDIDRINQSAKERLGYPTQKPRALLERIIQASSNEDDVVMDPFCGCGTTIEAAEKLKRRWVGIDITHLAIGLIKKRLIDAFGDDVDLKVEGEPTVLGAAIELAKHDKYQFQWWALGMVGARPAKEDQKKGADGGIDGRLYFHDDGKKTKQIIISVKGGKNISVSMVRDLVGTVQANKAQIGVLISIAKPTKPMRVEATKAGFYETLWGKFPKIQLLTVEDLFAGNSILYPGRGAHNVTHKKAPKVKRGTDQGKLGI